MLRAILKLFGYRMGYVSEYGWHRHKYDRWGGFFNWGHDSFFGRPIHPDMSVAPPWAKLKIERAKPSPPVVQRRWLCLGGHEWTGYLASNCPECGRRPSTEAPKD